MATADVRAKLLDSGIEAFYAKGFNATGVQEIADLACVPKGSFYNHFDSKDAFAAEVVERYWGAGTTVGILSDLALGNSLERLRLYFEALIAARKKAKFKSGCLVGNLSSEMSDQSEIVRKRVESIFLEWTKLLETCIADAQKSKLMHAELPASVLASFLLNAWQGTVLRAKAERNDAAFKHFMVIVFGNLLT